MKYITCNFCGHQFEADDEWIEAIAITLCDKCSRPMDSNVFYEQEERETKRELDKAFLS